MAGREPPQNTPQAFGEELRRLRESAGFSLDDIISETKVSRRVLQALESGKFQYLPERIFSRNFVRQFATTIGADGDRLVAMFETAWDRFLLTSGSHPALLVDEPPPRAPVRWQFWIPIALGLLILLVALVVVVRAGRARPTGLAMTRGSAGTVPTPGRVPSSRVPSPIPDVTVHDAVLAGEDEAIVDLWIQVDPAGECWIHYRDREGHTEQRLLPGGTRLVLELEGPVKLTIGNAGAATLLVGGVEYAGLGVPGQVVHAEVSRDGVRTLGAGDLHG